MLISRALLFLGFAHLRFQPVFAALKKEWSTAQLRYATFFDALYFLRAVAQVEHDWTRVD